MGKKSFWHGDTPQKMNHGTLFASPEAKCSVVRLEFYGLLDYV